jgi:hypothetical protein
MKVLRMALLLLSALTVILLVPSAEACITCHDFQVPCDAYKSFETRLRRPIQLRVCSFVPKHTF